MMCHANDVTYQRHGMLVTCQGHAKDTQMTCDMVVMWQVTDVRTDEWCDMIGDRWQWRDKQQVMIQVIGDMQQVTVTGNRWLWHDNDRWRGRWQWCDSL